MKSARINFGQPNTEYKLEINEAGEATSCYNQDTDTEYIGGGGGGSSVFSPVILTLNVTGGNGYYEEYNGNFVDWADEDSPSTGCYIDEESGVTTEFSKSIETASESVTVYLIENGVLCLSAHSLSDNGYTVTGDCEVVQGGDGYYYVKVWGDCSISTVGIHIEPGT